MKRQPSNLTRCRLTRRDDGAIDADAAMMTRLRGAAIACGLILADSGVIGDALIIALYHDPRDINAAADLTQATKRFASLAEEITDCDAIVDDEHFSPDLIYL